MRIGQALLVSVLTLTACGQSPSSTDSATPRSMSDLRITMATKARKQTNEREDLIQSCMKQQGFDYERQTLSESAPDPANADSPYGYTASLRSGVLEIRAAPTLDTLAPPAAANGDAYWVALTGSTDGNGTGGCRGDAEAAVGADIVSPTILSEIEVALDDLRTSPAYQEALDSWNDCMLVTYPTTDFDGPGQMDRLLEAHTSQIAASLGLALPLSVERLATQSPAVVDNLFGQSAAFESELFDHDFACQQSSGLIDLQDQVLQSILGELPSDYFSS